MDKTLEEVFTNKYKKAIVTGGAGFIGSHICEALVKMGIETISIDNYIAGKKKNIKHLHKYSNFREENCDIRDKEKLEVLFEGVDIVFNEAASKKTVCLKDPKLDLDINAGGTLNLLLLSEKHGIKKFVHASTGSVYGEAKVTPQDELHPLNPTSYYGVSKLAGEKYVSLFNKLFNLNTTVLRYFHIYGSRQEFNEYGGVVAIFTRNLLKNEQPVIFGDGTQQRSFTYVNDVVKANILVSTTEQTKGETYNCASGIKVTIKELFDLALEVFGKTGQVEPKYENWLVGDIKTFDIDNSKIKQLGMSFTTDFKKGLFETIKELKKTIK